MILYCAICMKIEAYVAMIHFLSQVEYGFLMLSLNSQNMDRTLFALGVFTGGSYNVI